VSSWVARYRIRPRSSRRPAPSVVRRARVAFVTDPRRCGGEARAASRTRLGTDVAQPPNAMNLQTCPRLPSLLGFAAVSLVTASGVGCASLNWPSDEPGVPVAVDRNDEARVSAMFVETIAQQRATKAATTPIVTPKRERSLAPIATSLQTGSLSAWEALRAGEIWGHAAYTTGDVDAWVLDCTVGHRLKIPARLLSPKTVAISYAPAHFRPASSASEQCAIIVVAARSSKDVQVRDVDLL
jgi:hypothetical protein